MRIPKFLFICFTLLFTNIYSQNTITLAPSANQTSTLFDVEVRLKNSDLFKGLQFDISFSPDAFQLGTGHSLTDRATGFNLGVSSPAPGTGRVIIYSSNNAQITGGDGLLLTLKFRTKTLPGTFPFTVKNIVASDSLGASLSVQGSTQDMVVNGPVMNIVTPSVSFGEVPLLSTATQNIRIQNSGNMPLTISGLAAVAAPFGIQNNFPVIIQPNGIEDLTVTLNTSDKVETSVPIQFVNNDPDPLRNLQKSNASVCVFAVNEIYVGSGSGVISSEIQIPVAISNMEPFSGFQFDVILPAGFKFAPNSIVKSERFTGHMISSSVINSTTLRFIAYASDNSFFTGNSGEVFRFSITPNVSSGYYTLPVNSAIISNPQMGNIISQAYNGSVQINSPDLMISPNALNYGDVPITENRASSIMLTNNGSSELIINEISYDAPEITFDAALPISILPGDNKTVQMTLSPKQSGLLSKNISFKYNGPDYQKLLKVDAVIYSPNYLSLQSLTGFKNREYSLQLLLKNNDAIRAVQFDVDLPSGFTLKQNSITTTARTSGFTVSTSLLSGNKYRIIVYNLSGSTIVAGNTSVLSIPVFLENTVGEGQYQLGFSNIILSNGNNQNVASSPLESGTVTVALDGDNDGVADSVDSCPNTPAGDTVDNNGCSVIKLAVKAYLQGAYVNASAGSETLMRDDLRIAGIIPITSPYSDGQTCNPAVFSTTGNNAIVDWIFIELRDKTNSTIVTDSRSALLQRDGDVVDLDGISPLTFSNVNNSYYIVVKHRNHLRIISSVPIPLSFVPAFVNFTTGTSSAAGGSNALANMANGIYGLYGGDYDENGQVQNSDKSDVITQLGIIAGYSKADLDMNGQIQNADINNIINPNMGKAQQLTN